MRSCRDPTPNPAQQYKINIRRQHRRALRKKIINDYQQMEALELMVVKINGMVGKIIGGIGERVDVELKRDIERLQPECGVNKAVQMTWQTRRIWRQVAPEHILNLQHSYVSQLMAAVSQLNRLLATMQIDNIELVLSQEQQLAYNNNKHNNNNNSNNNNIKQHALDGSTGKQNQCRKLMQRLGQLVGVIIPWVMYMRDVISHANTNINTNNNTDSCNNNSNNSNSNNNSNSRVWSKLLNSLQQNCLQILCQLSPIYYLRQYYTNINIKNNININTNTNTNTNININMMYQQMMQQMMQQIMQQPLMLLLSQIKYFLSPPSIFYKCLVAIGNLLCMIHHQQQHHQYQHQHYYIHEHGDDEVQYYYKILKQNSLEEVLVACLGIINGEHMQQHNNNVNNYDDNNDNNYGNDKTIQQCGAQSQRESTTIWFINIYTRLLYAHNLPIYDCGPLASQVQHYIKQKLTQLAYKNSNNRCPTYALSPSQIKQLKPVINLMTYINMRPDNHVLYYVIVPLVRGNWQWPVMAKLWLWLSYNLEYDIDCVVMENIGHGDRDRDGYKRSVDNRRQTGNNRAYCWDDQITIKGNKYNTQPNHHRHDITQSIVYSPTYTLISQIMQTISTTSTDTSTSISMSNLRKRNKDLLNSVYNMMLNVQQREAAELWRAVNEEHGHVLQAMMVGQDCDEIIKQIDRYVAQCSQ